MDLGKEYGQEGATLLALGRYEEAIVYFDKALEIDPNDTMALYNKGTALLALGRSEEAIVCFDKAIQINPLDADSWHKKGMALWFEVCEVGDDKKGKEASRCFKEAIQLDPNYKNRTPAEAL